MAKITFDPALGDRWLEDLYDEQSLEISRKSSSVIEYRDQFGSLILATGKGLVVAANGSIKSGTVTALSFRDATGQTLLDVSGANFSASKLKAAFDKHESLYDLMTFVTAGNDTFVGSDNGEQITIGDNAGNDTINAGGGDDFVLGSAGADTMNGGSGYDTLSYQGTINDKKNAKTGIVLDALKGTVKDSWGSIDKIKGFEAYRGSYLGDTLTGSDRDEGFMGLGGRDVIDGKGGWDSVRYNRDERFGGTKGITADLSKGTVVDGFGTIDKIKNIEEVRGTAFADKFVGNALDNGFSGFEGKDSFNGGDGYDWVDFTGGEKGG